MIDFGINICKVWSRYRLFFNCFTLSKWGCSFRFTFRQFSCFGKTLKITFFRFLIGGAGFRRLNCHSVSLLLNFVFILFFKVWLLLSWFNPNIWFSNIDIFSFLNQIGSIINDDRFTFNMVWFSHYVFFIWGNLRFKICRLLLRFFLGFLDDFSEIFLRQFLGDITVINCWIHLFKSWLQFR